MKKKNKVTLLTNAELAIMQILWCSDRPLERSEVCAAAEKKSIHLFLIKIHFMY